MEDSRKAMEGSAPSPPFPFCCSPSYSSYGICGGDKGIGNREVRVGDGKKVWRDKRGERGEGNDREVGREGDGVPTPNFCS